MNNLHETIGEICKILIPIPEKVYYGNTNSQVAICTLSSINLLKYIANSDIMNKCAIVGRLLSENKGIDSIVRYVHQNKNIKTIIICGNEVQGHNAGKSLIALHEFGIDHNSKIINSDSPDPFLQSSKKEIEYFCNKISLINKIGETDIERIRKLIKLID